MRNLSKTLLFFAYIAIASCSPSVNKIADRTASEILGNPEYTAFSYGGYRERTRDIVPGVDEIMEDLRILSALDIKVLRTYNTQQYAHAANLLEAIHQLKMLDPAFEMYVMLGAWIDCEGAWTDTPNHEKGDTVNNSAEINMAVKLCNKYPDIVKIIAVGNEAMVHWATSYFVPPAVILKWVEYLQELKKTGKLPSETWITSSDNFASWGGGDISYHIEDLASLMKAVDYISLHTYPFHDSHYNPQFWLVPEKEEKLSEVEQIEAAMRRAKEYAISQYKAVVEYMDSIGIEKDIHIGETGWASVCGSQYGPKGSRAADEFKEKLYYEHMREWTDEAGISCFYFEAFDEQWKDPTNVLGSENHFGLMNLQGQAKYALWDMVDGGAFKGLSRNGVPITKSFGGDFELLMKTVLPPPSINETGFTKIKRVDNKRKIGESVNNRMYVITGESMIPDDGNVAFPGDIILLNPWESTCTIIMNNEDVIEITSGSGEWWGCGLEVSSSQQGEDMTVFKNGKLHFEIKGNTSSSFHLGFQTGRYTKGDQVNNFVTFGKTRAYSINEEWTSYSIPIDELNKGANLKDVTGLLYLMGEADFDGKMIYIKNIYYTR